MSSNIRPADMKRINTPELAQAFIDEQVKAVREQVGDKRYCWHSAAGGLVGGGGPAD